jgi:hypothetical protein
MLNNYDYFDEKNNQNALFFLFYTCFYLTCLDMLFDPCNKPKNNHSKKHWKKSTKPNAKLKETFWNHWGKNTNPITRCPEQKPNIQSP